jgi:hypothetical protein
VRGCAEIYVGFVRYLTACDESGKLHESNVHVGCRIKYRCRKRCSDSIVVLESYRRVFDAGHSEIAAEMDVGCRLVTELLLISSIYLHASIRTLLSRSVLSRLLRFSDARTADNL